MKNTIISSVIFFPPCFCSIFNNKLINVCDKVNDYSNKIENSLSKEDWKESYEESLKLSNLLEENYVSLSLYINHEQLDNLSKEILSLTQYIKAEDVSNSLSSVHIIKSYTKHIKDIQKVNIGNILNSNLKIYFIVEFIMILVYNVIERGKSRMDFLSLYINLIKVNERF